MYKSMSGVASATAEKWLVLSVLCNACGDLKTSQASTFFATREWAFWRFIFQSVIRVSIFFRSWSAKYAFIYVWFVNQRLLWEYFFLLFGAFSVIGKLVDYTKLDVERAHSMRPCGCKTDRELTTATVSLEGLESAIMDKSLRKNLHFEPKSDGNTTSPA